MTTTAIAVAGADTRAALAAVASQALRSGALPIAAEPLDPARWQALLHEAGRERLTACLVRAIGAGALAALPDQLIEAATAAHAERARVAEVEDELRATAARFVAAGIGFRVLKGAAHARLAYPDPGLRSFVDVDVLVPGDQVEAAVGVLTAAGGQRRFAEPRPGFDRRFSKGASFEMPSGVEVDLHRTLAPGPFGLTIDLPGLLADVDRFTFPGAATPFPALDPTGRFLHACLHAELGDAVPRLTALLDVAVMQQGDLDTARVLAVARTWRAEVVVAAAVQAAAEAFGGPPSALVRWAERATFPASQRRRLAAYHGARRSSAVQSLSALAAVPGTRDKVAYAWALGVPRRDSERAGARLRRAVAAASTLLRR